MRALCKTVILIGLGALAGCNNYPLSPYQIHQGIPGKSCVCVKNDCNNGCVRSTNGQDFYCNSLYNNTECKSVDCGQHFCDPDRCQSGYYYNGYRDNGWRYCEVHK